MNTPVSFEIAKLLKEKGFDEPVVNVYSVIFYKLINITTRTKVNNTLQTAAPTIADVVMWLYKKHGIWTVVNVNIIGSWYFEHFDLKEKRNAQFKPTDTHYDSPTEAYEAAIEHTLKSTKL